MKLLHLVRTINFLFPSLNCLFLDAIFYHCQISIIIRLCSFRILLRQLMSKTWNTSSRSLQLSDTIVSFSIHYSHANALDYLELHTLRHKMTSLCSAFITFYLTLNFALPFPYRRSTNSSESQKFLSSAFTSRANTVICCMYISC